MKFEKLAFATAVGLIQCFGIAILIMVGVWMGHYRGGFAWDGTAKQFNYHPVYMILCMIFLNSEAMIIYRVFSEDDKARVKILHMFIQMIAFGFGVTGLKAVFDFHNHMGIPNMYSLHSWLGITVFVLFSCQLACGFLGFLFPKLPDGPRTAYLNVHVFFGTAIFLLSIATCLTGITEKTFFSISKTYKDLPTEGVLINLLGVFLVIHGGLTYFITTNPNYKRIAATEEHQGLLKKAQAHEETDAE